MPAAQHVLLEPFEVDVKLLLGRGLTVGPHQPVPTRVVPQFVVVAGVSRILKLHVQSHVRPDGLGLGRADMYRLRVEVGRLRGPVRAHRPDLQYVTAVRSAPTADEFLYGCAAPIGCHMRLYRASSNL